MSIEIFDLDGTLTEEYTPSMGDKTDFGLATYSLWNLITRQLVSDPKQFDEEASRWKSMVTSTPGIDKTASSKDMTERGIRLLPVYHRSSQTIQKKASEITHLFLDKHIVVTPAIDYLRYRLDQGTRCVISTASYEEGAIGFIECLVERGLIPQTLADNIIYSGTQIDWASLTVVHMNVDEHKIRGIEKALAHPIQAIQQNIKAVFGDDPLINDRALLNGLGELSFVIRTEKNKALHLPSSCVFSAWDEIWAYRDALGSLHAKLKEKSMSVTSSLQSSI